MEQPLDSDTVETFPRLYDLAIAWNWRYDEDFISLIERSAHARHLTTYVIAQHNVDETLALLQQRKIAFRVALDRASDEDEGFQPLARYFSRRSTVSDPTSRLRIVNPYDLVRRAADKAAMHLEFLARGVAVPYTIIISPYAHRREVELSLTELSRLGLPFIVKPARTTGGGMGVVLGAESLKDIIETRKRHKNDKYLLQETVKPAYLGQRRAWFRVFHAFGTSISCWWDDQIHLYQTVTPHDEELFSLKPLRSMVRMIQEVCRLDFFSTEIALTQNLKFVVVDYVNEMCDMRFESRHRDGVPDSVVQTIVNSLMDFTAENAKVRKA